jgi:DMSO/TMAO reductase YedYZ molybdopterin-dependent catalytic subunit
VALSEVTTTRRAALALAAAAGGAVVLGKSGARAEDALTISVGGEVGQQAKLTVADLDALPPHGVSGAWSDADEGAHFTASGPLLYDVINACMPLVGQESLARMGVVVTGADGYTSVFSWIEIAPEGSSDPVIVATEFNGEPLRDIFQPAWVINPEDKTSLRAVFSVVSLEFLDLAAASTVKPPAS